MPFPLPWEAVAVLRQVTIERLVKRDGFATLEEWFNFYSANPTTVRPEEVSSTGDHTMFRKCLSVAIVIVAIVATSTVSGGVEKVFILGGAIALMIAVNALAALRSIGDLVFHWTHGD